MDRFTKELLLDLARAHAQTLKSSRQRLRWRDADDKQLAEQLARFGVPYLGPDENIQLKPEQPGEKL